MLQVYYKYSGLTQDGIGCQPWGWNSYIFSCLCFSLVSQAPRTSAIADAMASVGHVPWTHSHGACLQCVVADFQLLSSKKKFIAFFWKKCSDHKEHASQTQIYFETKKFVLPKRVIPTTTWLHHRISASPSTHVYRAYCLTFNTCLPHFLPHPLYMFTTLSASPSTHVHHTFCLTFTPGATSEACEHQVRYTHVTHSRNKAHKDAFNKQRGALLQALFPCTREQSMWQSCP
jgi:hypothetical protein